MRRRRAATRSQIVSLPLAGMEDMIGEQRQAQDKFSGEMLTAAMYRPGRDISATAGEMERHSPLFYGSGADGMEVLFK